MPSQTRGTLLLPVTSWDGPEGTQDAPLSCPVMGKRSQVHVASPSIRYLEKRFQNKSGETLGQPSILGDNPASARESPEQPNLCCICFEWGLVQRAPDVPSASATWWCYNFATWCLWCQEWWCHLLFIWHKIYYCPEHPRWWIIPKARTGMLPNPCHNIHLFQINPKDSTLTWNSLD